MGRTLTSGTTIHRVDQHITVGFWLYYVKRDENKETNLVHPVYIYNIYTKHCEFTRLENVSYLSKKEFKIVCPMTKIAKHN